MPADPPFLGRGWAFPPAFTRGGAEAEMVSGAEDIRQSLEILLATNPAERILAQEFGCDLTRFQFEEMDRGFVNGLTSMVSDAILLHEPRISLEGVEVTPDSRGDGRLLIRIDYIVRATNSRFNMVYPYYLNEATRPSA
jgi:phage baseplate assembly protein W